MKYYIKDDIVFIKYISGIDGKIKTLEFDVNEDKEFLKKLFNEKDEEVQIFMLDDVIRERKHPTDENVEYITTLKLVKPSQEDEKQKKYDFDKIKLQEQENLIKELSQKIIDKGDVNDDEMKQLKSSLLEAEKRKNYYENEMKSLIKTSNDVINKPKTEQQQLIEELLKNKFDNVNQDIKNTIIENLGNIEDKLKSEKEELQEILNTNLKESNESIKNIFKQILEEKGYNPEKIDSLMEESKNVKEFLNKISNDLTEIEKEKITAGISNVIQKYQLMICFATLFNVYEPIQAFSDFNENDFKIINNILGELKKIKEVMQPSDILLLNKEGFTDFAKKDDRMKGVKVFNDKVKVYMNSIYSHNEEQVKRYIKPTSLPMSKNMVEQAVKSIEDFLNDYNKFYGKGINLPKLRVMKKKDDDINEKFNILVKNYNMLKDDYINFKEDIKKQIKELKDKSIKPKPFESKKEIEIKPFETKKEIEIKPDSNSDSKPDFLDLIKNFSKEKLKKTEPIKYIPDSKPSLLEETFKKRREAFEMSEDGNDDDNDWD